MKGIAAVAPVAALGCVAMLSVVSLVGACGTQVGGGAADDEPPRISGGTGSANLTYQPSVRVIERAEGLRALVSVSTDGSTLVFDRTRGEIPALAPGDVVLIKGLLVRKVIAADTQGNETAVLTVPAGLPEIVMDGQIRVQAPIRFGEAQAHSSASARPSPSPWARLSHAIVPTVYGQSPTEERRKQAERTGVKDAYGNLAKAPFKSVMSGWETEFAVVPVPGRLNVSLKMKKSLAGVTALITGEGYLADFDFSSEMDVERGVVERLQVAYKKLNGTMNFKWEVQTTKDGELRGNASIKLPAAIEIPLYQYLGGLPLFLEISAAVIIKPALGASYQYSHGSFRVTYDGYQTFRVKEGNVDADGNVTGDIELLESKNMSPMTATGMVVAFAAPRLELSLGVSKVLKFDGMKEAAEKADKAFDVLATRVFGREAVEKFKKSPMSQVTSTKIVDAAMGSNAAAYIQLVTTSGMSYTGSAVMAPCSRMDLHMGVKVGASATAFGQSVGNTDKEIFGKDLTRVYPSENALCGGGSQ